MEEKNHRKDLQLICKEKKEVMSKYHEKFYFLFYFASISKGNFPLPELKQHKEKYKKNFFVYSRSASDSCSGVWVYVF